MKTLKDSEKYLKEEAVILNELMAFDKMEMYRHLTESGQLLGDFPKEYKIEDNFVKGCTSEVYIKIICEGSNIKYKGYSASHIVRGYVYILTQALSGLSKEDIINGSADLIEEFATTTDIKASLTPSRANAFGNIYQLMKEQAERL